MNIKRYIAASAQEALQMVKREMGSEAVILRTRTLHPAKEDPAGDRKSVEVTAAVDYEPSGDGAFQANPIGLKEIQDRYLALEAELREIKEAVLSADAGTLLRPEVYYNRVLRTHYLHFKAFGLRPEIICDLMKDGEGGSGEEGISASRLLQDSLSRVLRCISIPGNPWIGKERKVLSFIGPTGVGKTTTLAKLAALSAIREGRKAALVTVDTFRVAAVAQLESYARIMGIPLEVASNNGDLRKAVHKHRECDVVMIDTAGRSPNQEGALRELKGVLDIPVEVHPYLVLSATTRYEDLLHVDRQFGSLPFKSYIFTKLDETEDAASMINFLISRNRPVSYFSTGQQVPEDIEAASKRRLASLLLTRIKRGVEKPVREVHVYGSGERTEGYGSRLEG